MSVKSADKVDIEVGQRIRARREAAKFTQTALADQLGVTFQQVQKYEKGVNRVAAGRLSKIAHVLGVPIGALLNFKRRRERRRRTESSARFRLSAQAADHSWCTAIVTVVREPQGWRDAPIRRGLGRGPCLSVSRRRKEALIFPSATPYPRSFIWRMHNLPMREEATYERSDTYLGAIINGWLPFPRVAHGSDFRAELSLAADHDEPVYLVRAEATGHGQARSGPSGA